jgi:exodeoxyribonuclease V gamma subunit
VLAPTVSPKRYSFGAWSRADATSYLGLLLSDLLSRSHDYLLPCEAVFERRDNPERALAAIVERRRSSREELSSRYGPVSPLDELSAPDAAEADAMIARRFAPLFARMEPRDG